MAVRCLTCGRLSRDEVACEWCQAEIPAPAGLRVAGDATGREDAASGAALAAIPAPGLVGAPSAEAAVAAGPVAGSGAAAESSAEVGSTESAEPEEGVELPLWHWDNDTRWILALILLQFGLTLYLGRLSSWWSVTGFLWLVVGYGVVERFAWSLALPLVLFTVDVALLLFGIGPRQRAGFLSLAPLDFFLYLLRLVIWALIWRLQDQLD